MIASLQHTNNNSDNSIIKLPQPPPPQEHPNNSSTNNHHRTLSKQQQKHSAVAHDVLKLFTSTHHPLHAIFHPKSVVLIGASERTGSVGRTILWNLISSPFGGSIYFVNSNPRRKSVFGIKTYLRVQDVLSEEVGNNDDGGSSSTNSSMEDEGGDGGSIDLAIIAVPAHAVKDVLQDCVEVGVKGAIILSAGFKEVGVEGAQLESEIRTIAQHGNIRVIGPNCLGVMNPITGLNATFATHLAKPGNVAFISQSGAMCTSILDWSLQANVGFSAFVSIGSMMDVSWGDIIYYLGDDPNTKAIAIYMESIGDARSFMSAASEVAMSKPIILIKPGRTDQAAKAAASHTGSLAGSDDVLDAAFKRCGVLRVNKIRDVFEIVELLGKQPRPSGKYLTILTNAGGPGVISTDALIESGGQLAWLSEDTMNRLNDILPSSWSHANPIDVLGDATWETYSKAVEIASENEFSDGILIILTPQSMTDPTRTAQAIADVAKKIKKPILASWMGGKAVAEGRAILDAAGIPTYDYPDSAAEMFSYMYQLEVNLNQLYETPRWCADFVEAGKSMTVDSIISNAQSQGRVILTELESKLLLSCYSIPTPPTIHCRSAEEAAAAATSIGFPVVVKLHSETITHKTDVGGVKLNLHSSEQVCEAFNEMQQGVNETDFLGVTVQPMFDTADSFELIIGTSLDNQFGPVMLFGTGGTLVEVFNDKSLALPPLNSNLAHLMMKNTKIYKALKGVRGRKSADIPAIEKLIVNFSHLIMDKWMFIKEVEM
jgi:acetyltransferase